jgi:hypothetical protein
MSDIQQPETVTEANTPPTASDKGGCAALTGSEVKCKCADCGKEITYCTIQLCDDCYNYRSDESAWNEDSEETCDCCGGEGVIEYADHPEVWGEDCPSYQNHLLPCPECRRREERQKANPPNAPHEPHAKNL